MQLQIMQQQLQPKQTKLPISQRRTTTLLMMKALLLRLNCLAHLQNVSGDGVTVSGSTVTISKAGTYVISGQSDGVQIKVEADKSDDVKLVLKGATMTKYQCSDFCDISRSCLFDSVRGNHQQSL